jgi:ABC-type transporter Mla MlaB component
LAVLPPRTVAFAIEGSVAIADVPALCERLCALIERTGATLAVCDVDSLAPADLAAIEALARLRLTARRRGCDVELYGASRELTGLLVLAGLADVLLAAPALHGEVGWEPEQREDHARVEKEGELPDPPI